MQITKYPITNSRLSRIAEFIWNINSETGITNGMLLPVINTDLIINLSTPISYRFMDGDYEKAPLVHVRNVKLKPQIINQEGPINVWGVSLYSFGIYPILGIRMNTKQDNIINLQQIKPNFSSSIIDKLTKINTNDEGPLIIETGLLNLISKKINNYEIEILDNFIKNMNGLKVGEYCNKNKICIRRLERLSKKYTGLSPKQLCLISRFQRAGNDIIYSVKEQELAEIAYSHDYFDQMHLTRDFKKYTGITPYTFLHQNNSVKKIINEHK